MDYNLIVDKEKKLMIKYRRQRKKFDILIITEKKIDIIVDKGVHQKHNWSP